MRYVSEHYRPLQHSCEWANLRRTRPGTVSMKYEAPGPRCCRQGYSAGRMQTDEFRKGYPEPLEELRDWKYIVEAIGAVGSA